MTRRHAVLACSFALGLLALATWEARAEDGSPALPRPVEPTTETRPARDETRPAVSVDEHRTRRENLIRALGDDAVALILSRGAAKGFTGRKRSDAFHYLTPFAASGAAVVLHVENGVVRHRVYLPPRRAALERWNGPTVGPGEATATTYGFDAALPAERLDADLGSLLDTRSLLAVSASAPAAGRRRLDELLGRLAGAFTSDRPLHLPGTRVPDDAPGVRVVPASRALTDLRAVKSATEIGLVRRAVEATVEGLRDAARTIAPGVGEFQVQAIVELRCRFAGCLSQAFDSIVGSGPNSCVLHYTANTRIMRDGELVVVDVGGEYQGYAADVTRTFPVSGTFSARQAEVYDAVLEAQRAGIAAVRPGATHRDVHEAAKSVLREHGLDRWFIHGTCHSVGLNVHDAWGRGRKLQVGSILTVEPGVYIADEALGVRIEDTVLVTEEGPVILSAGVPKDRADVEALMREPPPLEPPTAR